MAQLDLQQPLRREVRRLLLDRLLSGELEPGSRINESRLAEEIGVSRTPLREALIKLELEGFMQNDKGRGFYVVPLSPETARDLYTLAGQLEALALEGAVPHTRAEIERLETLEAERAEAKRGGRFDAAVELDIRWHAGLVGGCPNGELLHLLEMLRNRLYRYEYVLAQQRDWQSWEHDHHERILQALREGNRRLAVETLKHHWNEAAEVRARWLEQPQEPAHEKWTSLM